MKQLENEYPCAINLVIDLIGGKWKVLILWNLNRSTKRFSELQRAIPGITQKVLAQQLKELEEQGLIIGKAYPIAPARVEYSTAELGKKLQRTLNEMCNRGDQYADAHQIERKECWIGSGAAVR
ncbi:winged helix-turn-helix transcriptional regulator [Metabacillus sp. 84]|uniref:winged helix-turn-helix transcriptional regulator n=1 Tax=Metabacillus sp. 84 TaxID=3404705 RepID=UPI003CF8F91C